MKITFSFGKNWVDYVNNVLDEERIDIARDSLLQYLPEKKYEGKTFIDIGCGSGPFSLNALRLRCRKVVSFDIDKQSIEATKMVKDRFSSLIPQNSQWEIFEGNILDEQLVDRLEGKGDIVYSWGVLHHTGNMYQAIKNTARLVKLKGYLILAIYNRAPSSDFWLKFKKFYNNLPKALQMVLVYPTYYYLVFRRIVSIIKRKIMGQNTESLFSRERGMSIFYDLIDWFGGYPYEFATFEEIKGFVENLEFKLIKAPIQLSSSPKTFLDRFSFSYTGNNEFVFQKKDAN